MQLEGWSDLPAVKDLRLSYSGASVWRACPMKWFFSYIHELTGKTTPGPMQVGKVVHDILFGLYTGKIKTEEIANMNEIVEKMYPDLSPAAALEIAFEASRLVTGYWRKYENDPIQMLSPEMQLEVLREEPVTGKKYRIFCIVDGVGRTQDKRLWRLEHKTAAKMDSYYLQGLRGGLQGGIYHWALNQSMPEPVVGTIYNLLVKTKVPQFERMPVLMQNKLAERSLSTFDAVARQIWEGDIFQDAGSCFQFNGECWFLPLCNVWKGQWDQQALRVKEAFFVKRQTVQSKPAEGQEGETK